MLSRVKVSRVLTIERRPRLVGLFVIVVRPLFFICRHAVLVSQAMVIVSRKRVCVAGGLVSVCGLLEVSAGLFLHVGKLGLIGQTGLFLRPLPWVTNSWLFQSWILSHHFLRIRILSIDLLRGCLKSRGVYSRNWLWLRLW